LAPHEDHPNGRHTTSLGILGGRRTYGSVIGIAQVRGAPRWPCAGRWIVRFPFRQGSRPRGRGLRAQRRDQPVSQDPT